MHEDEALNEDDLEEVNEEIEEAAEDLEQIDQEEEYEQPEEPAAFTITKKKQGANAGVSIPPRPE